MNEKLRPVLWLLLILGLAANAAASTIGAHQLVGSVFGLVALASGTGLAIHHYRYRRQ
ncbi:hypothetical protein [Actinoplanes couchii]|uniref:Secreted protein n=1 Tax=Actinoplanes couchii TaxID=403638 RepID=A0ABQ3XKN6_9ACTN|nr:hypothetical protein [Actinoplanes couchii]MDR6320599.1 hypothetical protein [Actinoplanes couchii]GID59002.1 hypothetical protein Aco03nite_074060 [Actinoplanes couchii]